MSIDPIKVTEKISSNYRNYLSTTFRFQDPRLQEQLLQGLSEQGRFIKGPILEATPAFVKGASIARLVHEGVLSPEFLRLGTEALPVERELHQHQEQALRKLVVGRRNIVVSTGTGSGKTETFLIPILDHLFKEAVRGLLVPGIRALLLYPMNALANDQLKRLRLLLANYPRITFGRYTGETEQRHSNALSKHRKLYGADPLANELISREQMWEMPPHILLTNYAMLEFLLLRPRDTVFFDGDQARYWRFIVIDEAHSYSGAKGIEIAMLLRRLKDRVVGSDRGKLQCVATSATLGGGRADFPQVVQYAERLFGEDFQWSPGDPGQQDVVEATRVPLADGNREGWGRPDPRVYREWEGIIERGLPEERAVQEMREHAVKSGIPPDLVARAAAGDWREFLYEVLQEDTNLLDLKRELQDQPRLLAELPPALNLESEFGSQTVASLVNLANQARIGDSMPLLPARYHLFVRAIEGAYLALQPKRKLFLERREKIREQGSDYRVFETATCRQCGAAYLVGQRKPENGHEILSMAGERGKVEYFLLLDQGANLEELDEDEEVEFPEGKDNEDKYERYLLCLRCGAIDQENILMFPCECGKENRVLLLRVPSRDDRISFCPACGKRSSGGVARRFLVGADAVATVLGSVLYQEINPGKLPGKDVRPIAENDDPWAGGPTSVGEDSEEAQANLARKLLVFSDSRQDAAFFAPYLSRTYNQIVHRHLIVCALRDNADLALQNAWRVQDLIAPVRQAAVKCGFFTDESPQEQTNEVWKWVMHEFIGSDRKISLEGLGVLGFSVVEPSHWAAPRPLLEGKWGLASPEVLTLLQVLLNSLRTNAVIKFPDQVSPQDDFFKPRNREYFVRANKAVRGRIFSWNSTRTNGRLDYLLRLAATLGTGITEEECREALAKIWASVLRPESSGSWAEYFISQTIRQEGVTYQLRHSLWRIHSPLVDGHDRWYICDKCQNLTLHNLRGICPSYRCDGRLQSCDPGEMFQTNHYRQQYLNTLPIRMRAEEHTAQLTSEAAAQLQNTFITGGVNILSCSTTFELGVDVGELEAVFMKNMPPSAANYIQRAGRAGRRTDSNAFALTFAQRRSHDLDHFREPWRMVAGKIGAPYFTLENEKIVLRHVYACALAAFWREYRDLFGKVEDFFFASQRYGPRLLQDYLAGRPQKLKESLLRIVPPSLHRELDLENWGWVDRLFGEEQGLMLTAASEIVTDVSELEQLKQELFNRNNPVEHLRRLIKTLKEKDIIGFLSNHNIIPQYGFPVDVVQLQIFHHSQEAGRLQLERDLRIALAEYAPSSQVVAGGKLWTSRYIRRLPEREWERYRYAICDECQSYTRERAELADKMDCCPVCGTKIGKNQGVFIVPAFGFIANPEEPGSPGEEKPERTYSTRVYFSGDSTDDNNMRLPLGQGLVLELTSASRGKLAVINNAGNRGFQVCRFCGFTVLGSETVPSSHKTHWGKDCSGKLQKHFSLGHEFETDIVKLYFAGYADIRQGFWTSLLYALIEGASSALQIERQDLDGCLYPTPGNPAGSPTLVLYDDVPGGAGHVRRLASEDALRDVLMVSLKRLERCECGGPEGDASCYGCLRHYRNQYCHAELRRGTVVEFLRGVLDCYGMCTDA